MAARKGTLLEQNIETIFSSAGFDTETNTYHSDYEIDVYAEMGDIDVVAECKQYENSNLSVRNLIHEWKGKMNRLKRKL
jgi:Holliday junction resolvase